LNITTFDKTLIQNLIPTAMIKLQVIGNLGRDAVINTVGEKTVINFSLAHTEKYKDPQGNQLDRTTWVECAYWTDRTAVAPYLTKGKTVFVEGTPSVEAYTTKEGKHGVTLRLRVLTVQLIGGASNPNPPTDPSQGSTSSETSQTASTISGDTPF
jgi:single-strand DNA-binding protein